MAPGRPLKGESGPVKVKAEKDGTRHIYIDGEPVLDLSQMEAEEVVAALTSSLRPYAGYSIFEKITQELDAVIDRLMSEDGEAEDDRDPGRAEALTKCLAMIRNPYQPDYAAEKERQMERWERRNGEGE